MKKFLILFVLVFGMGMMAHADETTWTPQERMANRDAVVKGKVLSITRFAEFNETESMWVATISVEKIIKANKLVSGKTIEVYFLSSGSENDPSPRHVHLNQGEVADFYLDVRPLIENKEVLFLAVPADVKG